MDKGNLLNQHSPQKPNNEARGETTMENSARLVYSTDPATQNHIVLPVGFEPQTDAAKEAKCSILGIKQSLRRFAVVPIKKVDEDKKRRDIEKVVDLLAVRPLSYNDLYTKMFPGQPREIAKLNYLRNLTQQCRRCSRDVIQTKNGVWQIDRNYVSGNEALVQTIMDNRKTMWREQSKQRRADKKALMAVLKKKASDQAMSQGHRPDTAPSSSFPVALKLDGLIQEPIDVPIRIVLTVVVKVEQG